MASLRSKTVDFTRLFSKVMVTFRFQNGVNIAKKVTTGSERYILAVFSRALKVKLWQYQEKLMSIQICSILEPDCTLFGS